jgi:hypothetical protein
MKADAVLPALAGLGFLAACVVALAWVVPGSEIPPAMWLFVFSILATCAYFTWQHEKAPKSPTGWLGYFAAALIAGLVSGAIDYWMFGTHASSLADLAKANGLITVEVACFGLAGLVALAGWVRAACILLASAA